MSERSERIGKYSLPRSWGCLAQRGGHMSERSERIGKYSCPARGAASRSEVGT